MTPKQPVITDMISRLCRAYRDGESDEMVSEHYTIEVVNKTATLLYDDRPIIEILSPGRKHGDHYDTTRPFVHVDIPENWVIGEAPYIRVLPIIEFFRALKLMPVRYTYGSHVFTTRAPKVGDSTIRPPKRGPGRPRKGATQPAPDSPAVEYDKLGKPMIPRQEKKPLWYEQEELDRLDPRRREKESIFMAYARRNYPRDYFGEHGDIEALDLCMEPGKTRMDYGLPSFTTM